jgi:gamma-butyrobetaine dioxygenase
MHTVLGVDTTILSAFSHDDHQLNITWADGHCSTYDSLWLRDNRPQDRDTRTGQRLVDVSDLPEDPRLYSILLLNDSSLQVVWVNEQESARFPLDWLRQHCYCGNHNRSVIPGPILWRGSDDGICRLRYSDVLEREDARLDWLFSLVSYGIAFLCEVPCEEGKVLSVAALAGYVTETNYGRLFDVKSVPDPNNLAYTEAGLGLHTDNPYRDPVPGCQLLHCLQCSDEGGGSLFADGFAIASDLQARDPQSFAILGGTPVRFAFRDAHAELTAERPLIMLDHRGAAVAIHYNNRSIMPLSLPTEQLRAYYRAYGFFSQMLREPRYIMRVRLQPGELVTFNNRRILHGRTAFRNTDVQRHLQGCYVNQDGVFSNLAVLQRGRQQVQS